MSLGGLSEAKNPNEEIFELVNSIKAEFEENNYKTEKFHPISYKYQIVSGTNFFVKIQTDSEYIHAKVYVSLSNEIDSKMFKLQKNLGDEIKYF